VAFFGVVPDGAYAIGQQRGYFAAEGITIETTRFSSSTDALPAISQGEIDIYGASPNPALFNAIGRGVDIRVLGPISTTAPGRDPNGVIVRKDLIDSGRYKTLSDLKGMKIAVGTAFSTSNYALKAAVEKGGLSLKDMDVSAIGVPNILPALANKAVDAAASTEPSLTQAEQQGIGTVVARLLDVAPPEKAGAGNGVLVASPSFLTKPGVDRFMIAWVRSEIELDAALSSSDKQVQDATVKLLNEHGVNVAVGVQQGIFPPQAERSTVGLQALLDWYREDGAVTTSIDVNTVANYELLGRAYQRLGAGGGNE
jgi:NitT/TauT family transport system substrate-binding protein